MPTNTLEVHEQSAVLVDEALEYETFHYPGGYAKKFNTPESRLSMVRPEGDDSVREEMEAVESAYEQCGGYSDCRMFTPGYKVTITSSQSTAPGGPSSSSAILLTSVWHHISQQPDYRNQTSPDHPYQNHFTGMPATLVYRPPERTEKPLMKGPQTAFVIADSPDSKEEIWPDKYGRVRVRFHWDREAKYACWLRVCQPWAGQNWGHQWIPRVGNEVLVSFLNGDPDCPIIVGSVYNKDNMPPFDLPAHKTQSGIKTRSSSKGTAQNFNMIRFEDKKGSEVLEIHAENSMVEGVEGSQTITVGGNRSITTGGEKDGAKHGDVKELVYKNHNLHVKGDDRIKIEGKSNVHVVSDGLPSYDGNYTLHSTEIVIDAKKITLQGDDKIQLIVGGSSVVLDAGGVTVIGPMVKLNPMGAMSPIPEIVIFPIDPDDP